MTGLQPVKTRFAPSPTGYMHLGNARTALFNALLAQAQGGTFLLRIEDTDLERSDPRYTEALQKDLEWLGIHWDEGPYAQMQRLDIYAHYYAVLIEQGLAYECYCNEQELAITRKAQISAGLTPRYSGVCRHLSLAQKQKKQAEGRIPCLRLSVPETAHVRFEDLIYGMKDFKAEDLGDFVIRKQDGGPTFMFANAIDDALMGVTQALRGEDHLTNTPRQVLLLELLGLKPPAYGHFPIILGRDGKPLSKRNGSQSIQQLRESGYLPEALTNYMARLGHSYATEVADQWMPYALLGKHFELERIGRSAARYDEAQLLHWQKQSVTQLSSEALEAWLAPSLQDPQMIPLLKDNVLFPQEAQGFEQQLLTSAYTFEPGSEAAQWLSKSPSTYWEVALRALAQVGPDAQKITTALKTELSLQGKALFMPLRLALSGQLQGPQLADLMHYLGATRVRQKLEAMQGLP